MVYSKCDMVNMLECSRCGIKITTHQWLSNTLGVFLFPKIKHSKYKIAKEYCRFSLCDACYIVAEKEIDIN